MQMRNRRGTDGFALQARTVTFNKLLGLSTDSAYATPPTPKSLNGEPKRKRSVDDVAIPRVINAEGRSLDLSKFNA
jgi:hypothetical protein